MDWPDELANLKTEQDQLFELRQKLASQTILNARGVIDNINAAMTARTAAFASATLAGITAKPDFFSK